MLDEYVTQTTKSKFQCDCGNVWAARPNNVLSGKGCPKCGKRSMAAKQTINKEVIASRLVGRGIQLIGQYVNTQTKAEFECEHGHHWKAVPNSVLQGNGCPVCAGNLPLSKDLINLRLAERPLQMISEYAGAHVKALFQCDEGHTWEARPANVLNLERGCPHCAKQFPLTAELVNERISDRGLRLLGEYTNNLTKTTFSCSEGHVWESSPANVLAGTGCPFCAGNIVLSRDIVNDRIRDRGIQQLGDYVNNATPSLFTCNACGNIWNTAPANVLAGRGCPKCADSTSEDNAFYIWTTDQSPVQDIPSGKRLIKFGRTGVSRGNARIKEVGWKWNVKPQVLLLLETRVPAHWVEAAVRTIGEPLTDTFSGYDGWTEFRIVTDTELAEMVACADSASASRIVWNITLTAGYAKGSQQLKFDF